MFRRLLLYTPLMIALLLAACQAVPPNLAAPVSTPQAPAQPSTGEARELVLWTHEFPTFTDGLRDKWIPEFEAAHPGVKVKYETFPYSGG
ncbi:MAG: hypothetical protein KDE01_18315, partial [Caldilineaceae bacterium]|nr:hypothetical protein [Caldilineaceae bacterium]